MQFTTYAETQTDIDDLLNMGMQEIILATKELSRFGRLSLTESQYLAHYAKEKGLTVILDWDILMTQNVFQTLERDVLSHLPLDSYDALRVQDPGALEWCLMNAPQMPIHLNLETGNHNLSAVQAWIKQGQGQIQRVILSIELPFKVLEKFCQALSVPVEILGLGRILIFYSPRNLLSALAPEDDDLKMKTNNDLFLEASGESQESPHKGFPLLENRHGTFMFHIKEFCLIEHLRELQEIGLAFFRVDLRPHKDLGWLKHLVALSQHFDLEVAKKLKQDYPVDTTKGYFNVNKSDVLFKKLKNHRIQRKDENYLGEVIEVVKGEYLAVELTKNASIRLGDHLELKGPEGKDVSMQVFSLRDIALNDIATTDGQKIILINYAGKVLVRSQVYRQTEKGL